MPASMVWQRSAVRKGRIRGRETKRDRQQETCHACNHGSHKALWVETRMKI